MRKRFNEMTQDEKDNFIKIQVQKMLGNYPKRHYDDVLVEDDHYMMTNDLQELRERFLEYNIPFPKAEDLKNNANLAQGLREKMIELKVHFSLTIKNNNLILNYYREREDFVPMIYIHSL